MVCRELKSAAGRKTLPQSLEEHRTEQTVAVVLFLRPRIRKEHINGFHRMGRKEIPERVERLKPQYMGVRKLQPAALLVERVDAPKHPLNAETVRNAFALVTAALDHSGYQKPKIKLPKKAKSDRPWLDYEQIQEFLEALQGKPYEIGAILALHGLRRSELLHITAEDIDTQAEIIHVRGASVIGEGNKLVDKKTNKNTTSTRDVHIVIPRLTELVNGKEGRLITTNPSTLYGSINGLCERVGLPQVGVHGLRHSYISLCFHLGWNIQTVMREGGYSDMQTVNEVYRHLAAQDANADIERMKNYYKITAK